MPVIPRVDLTIKLSDTGYAFRHTEGDGSTTLGRFGFQNPTQTTAAAGGNNQSFAGAFFPAYNTLGSPMTPTPKNFSLQSHSDTPNSITGSVPVGHSLWSFDGTNFLQILWDGVASTIQAKITQWPNTIDYSSTGMVTLVVSNMPPANGLSVGGISPVVFTDGTKGFVIWAMNDRGLGAVPELLPVRLNLNLTTVGWISDPAVHLSTGHTVTWPLGLLNYQADFSSGPVLKMWQVVFDLTTPTAMVCTPTNTATGTVSTDCFNALQPDQFQGPNDSQFYYTPLGLFGIDWGSGNNTGCWYCKFDCTAMGKVSFPMPDASLGPSSDPHVYWVDDFQNNLAPGAGSIIQFQFYPNWDLSGAVWWIRVPLVNLISGAYVLEALTGEVYTSLSTPPIPPGISPFIDPNSLPRIPLPFCIKRRIGATKCLYDL